MNSAELPRQLVLIRHYQTDKPGTERIIKGSRNYPLSEIGIGNARTAPLALYGAGRTSSSVPWKPSGREFLVTSDLDRAIVTGFYLAATLGVKPERHPDFDERDFGDIEGDLRSKWRGTDKWHRWTHDFDSAPPNGEKIRDVFMRAVPRCAHYVSEHPDRTIVIVSHGGPIRAILYAARQRTTWKELQNMNILHGFPYVTDLTPAVERSLMRWLPRESDNNIVRFPNTSSNPERGSQPRGLG